MRILPAVLIPLLALLACSQETTESGCTKDKDCKNNRVCEDGECVADGTTTATGTSGGTCAVCGAASLDCSFASGHTESKTFDSTSATGCSVSFDSGAVTVDCAAGNVCYAGQCSPQQVNDSFTFEFPGEGAVVCAPAS